jgi:hypothetical protein
MKISDMAASKLKEANCKTRLSGPTPQSRTCAAMTLRKPLCSIRTPFGTPVEPEV